MIFYNYFENISDKFKLTIKNNLIICIKNEKDIVMKDLFQISFYIS